MLNLDRLAKPIMAKKQLAIANGGKMVSQKVAILKTLFHVAFKYQKAYCYPSQVKILTLLKKHSHLKISRRTLNRRLSEMQSADYFTRTRRHREGEGGKILFNTTLYRLQGKAFNWLYGLGSLSKKFFSFFHAPKMAQYRNKTARDLSDGGSLGVLRPLLSSKGGPAGFYSFHQKDFLPE